MVSKQFSLGGQIGWYHTDSVEYGYFHTYDGLVLDKDVRKIQVFLPGDYESKRKKYPVIYMNDGNTIFYSGGLSPWSWEVDKTLDFLYKKDIIDKVIIVAVYPVNRVAEYLTEEQYFKINNKEVQKGGGVSNYADYLALKLKNFIDTYYYTDTNPAKTTIVGSSFGALASLYITAKYPDKFGLAGIMSASFPMVLKLKDLENKPVLCESRYLDEIDNYLYSAKENPVLWFDWSKYEEPMTVINPLVIERFKKNHHYIEGKELFYMEDPLGQHDERAWQYRFNLFLAHFYPKQF